MDLNLLEVFHCVVDSGSLSSAGRLLRMDPSGVSRKIKALEDQVGMSLILRSTRKMDLTEHGQLLYQSTKDKLLELKDSAEFVKNSSVLPQGKLRVSAPVGFGNTVLTPLVPQFLQKYPDIELMLDYQNKTFDLVKERIDVAVRIGPKKDSHFKMRRLAISSRIVFASPKYIKTHAQVRKPEDLSKHYLISNSHMRGDDLWVFLKDGKKQVVETLKATRVNNVLSQKKLALMGMGVCMAPDWLVAEDLKSGKLVQLLKTFKVTPGRPGYSPNEKVPVDLVFHPHCSYQARLWIDFLIEQVPKAWV